MSGKAVVASTVALILSIMCYFKGHGGSSHYTAASTAPLTSAYRHQCAEAIIDVNAKDYNSAVIGYRKRTLDEPWNYPRYASTPSSEPSYSSHSQ
ncbi:uncharacterized protein LOC135840210 [Planococcus citri]|uniref:uncharacterized protein LOC135840210 n=1 Tax=Planococcus citri TaxID=170843 RepID=UPI0031F98B69